jgi:hypothetical protein
LTKPGLPNLMRRPAHVLDREFRKDTFPEHFPGLGV